MKIKGNGLFALVLENMQVSECVWDSREGPAGADGPPLLLEGEEVFILLDFFSDHHDWACVPS